MIYVDPSVYAIGRILAWILFYLIFWVIYQPKKTYPLILIGLVSILLDIFFTKAAFLVTILLLYLGLNGFKKINLFLINAILLDSFLKLIGDILSQTTTILFFGNHLTTKTILGSCLYVGLGFLVRLILSLAFLFFYKRFEIEENWHIKTSSLFSLLFGYLYVVINIFMSIVSHFQAYSDLISGIMLFILIQCIFILIIFLKGNQIQKSDYTRELTKEQLKNLKMYTDQLEHDQIKLRGFEQNYKGVIAGLRKVALDGDYQKMQQSLSQLEDYSDSYFDNISMQLFKDLNNVQNPYLKSLLISKLTIINQNKTACHFECRDVVNDIPINIFDLVRLLGISIDNAIEATKNQTHGQIQIALIQEQQQLSFVINNTTTEKTDIAEMMQEGFTTKQHHPGLGMVNVQDIKKKYPNLFVQYRKNDKWFNLNIVIIK